LLKSELGAGELGMEDDAVIDAVLAGGLALPPAAAPSQLIALNVKSPVRSALLPPVLPFHAAARRGPLARQGPLARLRRVATARRRWFAFSAPL